MRKMIEEKKTDKEKTVKVEEEEEDNRVKRSREKKGIKRKW